MFVTAQSRKHWMLAAALLACFAVNVYVTILLRRHTGGIDALWTANAFLMAALIFLPRTFAVACALMCVTVQVATAYAFGGLWAQAIAFALINLGEAGAVAYMVKRMRLERLTTPGRIGRLVCFAIVPALVVFGVVAALASGMISGRPFVEAFANRMPAKLLGITLALPVIMLLAKRNSMPLPKGRELEAAGHYLLIAGLSVSAFFFGELSLFLMFPAVTALGLRLGPRAVTFAMMLSSAIVFPVAVLLAPGKMFDPGLPLAQQILMTQAFIGAAFFTGLACALGAKHQQRLRALFASRSQSAMRARDRAKAASVAKSEFLATMSHEIRTPLNSIIGFAQVLERRDDLPVQAQHHIGLIERSGGALLTVVNDILDFSKVEAGRLDLDPKPVSLKSVAEDALAIVAETAQRKGLTLSLTTGVADDAAHVIDDHRLRQVLLNFLNNAIKFTDTGAVDLSLAITPGEALDHVRFAVSDTGLGIPPQARERLFRRFTQVDSSISRSHGGTGLGLAICKGLVELMGGHLGVDSELGKGSTFWFELDLPRAEAIGELADDGEGEAGLSAHILLVDDHPMNRELGVTILALLGCTCDTATDGREAVEAVKARRYDAILMDLHMPGMDGLAATRAILGLPGPAAQTPIIAMSADVLPEHVERCRAAGMVDSVGKPINIEMLHACLTRWVGRNAQGESLAA